MTLLADAGWPAPAGGVADPGSLPVLADRIGRPAGPILESMAAQRIGAVAPGLLPHLRRARDHIDRNYRMPLDLEAVAAVAGVSKFHFARCFAAAYGETPIRYLTRRRVERAQDLLRTANLTVTEVCMAVGFASLGSFSARFHQLVGRSPTAYRNEWAARGVAHIPGCYLFMCGVLDQQPTALALTPTAAQSRRSSRS